MYDSITVSAQLLVLADRLGFGKNCSGENADKRYRHFTARPKLYAMMIAQLTEQKSLRTIEETIASDNGLYHVGVSTHITRSNLAHANDPRLRTNIHLRQESFFWRKKIIQKDCTDVSSREKQGFTGCKWLFQKYCHAEFISASALDTVHRFRNEFGMTLRNELFGQPLYFEIRLADDLRTLCTFHRKPVPHFVASKVARYKALCRTRSHESTLRRRLSFR